MVSSGACSEKQQGLEQAKAYRGQLRDLVKSLDRKIEFYGRVLDQFDRPVDGALVSMGTRHFSIISPMFFSTTNLEVKTDHAGYFEVSGYRGSDLFVGGISREGYEFIRAQNPRDSFAYSGDPPFIPDRNNPVIFRLRKKLQNRTFLFKDRDWGFRISPDQMNMWKATDIVEKRKIRPFDGSDGDEHEVFCDLKYRAVLDEKAQEWSVYFSACRAEGGVVVSEEELYEAPKEGYRDEWRIVIPVGIIRERDDDPPSPCLYIKSRSPSIYSKVVVKTTYSDPDMIRMYGKMTTNPYGDRVLDSVDLDSLTSHQCVVLKARLEAEARTMLGDGRLPPRPKIMALIEAVKRGDKTLDELERETQDWKTEKNPNYTHQYWKRAHEKMKRRDFKGAVEEFDEYLRRGGVSARNLVYYDKGTALEQLGDIEGALECYHSALEEFPEELNRFLPKLVRVREKMGQIEEALIDMEKFFPKYIEIKTQRLEEVEKELALLEERPDPRRYRKLYSEKEDLTEILEYWDGRHRKEKKQLEEKLKQQQPHP